MEDAPAELKFLAANSGDRDDVRGNDSGASDDDHDDCDEDHDHRDDEDVGDDLPYVAYPSQPITNDKPPVIRRGGGNTGAKGVLADYADAKRQERDNRERDKRATMEMIERMAFTVNNRVDHKPQEQKDYEDEDDEDEFMKEYRRKRIEEMQQAQRPTFGYLRAIDSAEYVDAIDGEKKDVFVVIHLYKNEIRECILLNHILQNLAIKYPYVKFLKIVSTEAKADYSDVGLPTLLVYQGGELMQRWVPVTVKLGKNFEQGDVELLLAKAKIIKSASIDKTGLLHKPKALNDMREYDDFSDEDEYD